MTVKIEYSEFLNQIVVCYSSKMFLKKSKVLEYAQSADEIFKSHKKDAITKKVNRKIAAKIEKLLLQYRREGFLFYEHEIGGADDKRYTQLGG